jgi:hypothetical protein
MERFRLESTDPREVAVAFKRWELEMRALRRAIISTEATIIEDLNRDTMVFLGVTFGTEALRELFRVVGMMVDPAHLEAPPPNGAQREYRITARYPWGHDRIL